MFTKISAGDTPKEYYSSISRLMDRYKPASVDLTGVAYTGSIGSIEIIANKLPLPFERILTMLKVYPDLRALFTTLQIIPDRRISNYKDLCIESLVAFSSLKHYTQLMKLAELKQSSETNHDDASIRLINITETYIKLIYAVCNRNDDDIIAITHEIDKDTVLFTIPQTLPEKVLDQRLFKSYTALIVPEYKKAFEVNLSLYETYAQDVNKNTRVLQALQELGIIPCILSKVTAPSLYQKLTFTVAQQGFEKIQTKLQLMDMPVEDFATTINMLVFTNTIVEDNAPHKKPWLQRQINYYLSVFR